MATRSFLEDNDPDVDNRAEYAPPPCALPIDESCDFDENGCEVKPSEHPRTR